MRVFWTSYDHVSMDSPMHVLGGVYEIAIYPYPEPPKHVKKWIIRGVSAVDDILIAKPYPPNDFLAGVSMANVTPLQVKYTLPENLYLP